MARWTLFLVGLAVSVALTAALWWAGIPGGALLLLFPFLWFPRRDGKESPDGPEKAPRRCTDCGFSSMDPDVRFCPRDGTRLS